MKLVSETSPKKVEVMLCAGTLHSGKPCNRKAVEGTTLCRVCTQKASKATQTTKQDAQTAIQKIDTPARVARMIDGAGEENLYTTLASVAGSVYTKAQDRLNTYPLTVWLEYAPAGWRVTDKKLHQGKTLLQVGKTRFSSKRHGDNLVLTIPSVDALLKFSQHESCKELSPAQVLILCAETIGCGWSRDTTLGATFAGLCAQVNPEMHLVISAKIASDRKEEKAQA